MTAALLHAARVSARRIDRVVLEPCSLSVEPGDRVAIYGPNGAGKSTMLQALAGLLPIASGTVSFRGKKLGQEVSLLEYHRRTAAVFQEPLLLRGTVRHNVELGLRLRGASATERDAPTHARLTDELAEILDERQIATLFVTHDFDEAAELCMRCVVLDAGRVLQQDDMASVAQRPSSRRVAEITGTPNIFEGRVIESAPDKTSLDWNGHRIVAAAHTLASANVEFMIRHEQIRLQGEVNGAINHIRGRVDQVRRRGKSHVVSIGVGNSNQIQVLRGANERPLLGEEVAVWFPPDAVWIFPRHGEDQLSSQ